MASDAATRPSKTPSGHVHHVIEQLQRAAQPLTGGSDDFTALLARVRDAKVVLIGEASHGTHEFYRVRQEITKRLILEAGFTAVAAEADWPSAFRVDQYVRGVADAAVDATSALHGFRRFPQWMWRNADMLDFVGWLRHLNDGRADPASSVGFFGLDLYSLHDSMRAVVDHLRAIDPAAAQRAAQRYQCFEPFGHDPVVYGRVTQMGLGQDCEQVAVAQFREMQERWRAAPDMQNPDSEAALFAVEQNARVVRNAERYYRELFQPRQTSWNLREQHMMDTLRALYAFLGRRHRGAKLVVWAHNSHVGDARATSQAEYGEVSLGQLCREAWESEVALVGFTTYGGSVLAADDWDHPGRHMTVRPALEGSVEWLLHETGIPAFALVPNADPEVQQSFDLRRLFRAIGVVYRPQTERQSHYVHTALARQFDTILHYDVTRAVEPLESVAEVETDELPETYPTAL
jgi:erythromycin esterase-like protein